LLSGEEAMAVFALGSNESFVVALTRDSVDWKKIPLGAEAVTEKVAASGKSHPFDLVLANELYGALLGPVEPTSAAS
jgi:hypothetical protein